GGGGGADAAMTDGSALLTSLFHALAARGQWNEARGANLLDGGAPFYRCYACRDGRFVAVGALEPRFYAALLNGLGIPADEAPQFDMAGWSALHARFAGVFATRDRDDWAARFADTDACVTPVLSLAEAPNHPHNVARGTFAGGRVVQPGPAPRFDGQAALPTPQAADLPLDEALARWS
ncbi:MAG: CoA transferase, partial [Brevundimonas sp.]|nr:CoA transferase [Brevundimonas sp.]